MGAYHIACANLSLVQEPPGAPGPGPGTGPDLSARLRAVSPGKDGAGGQGSTTLIIAADNLQVLNPAVARALQNLDPHPLQELARRCEQAGAQILDLNPGYLSPRQEDRMAFMVEAVQQVTRLRLMLDSPSARVLARGLAACEQPPILNACTLEAEKLREILPLAAAHQTDLVLLLLDSRSFPAAISGGQDHPGPGTAGARPGRGPRGPEADLRPGPAQPELARRLGAGAAGVQAVRLLAAGAVWPESRPPPWRGSPTSGAA